MSESEMQKYEKELCESYDHKKMVHILAGMEQTSKDTQKLANEYFEKYKELEAENEKLRKNNDILNDILETKAGSWGKQGFSFKDICDMQDRHQADCIKINQLNVTIDTLVDKLALLREMKGL